MSVFQNLIGMLGSLYPWWKSEHVSSVSKPYRYARKSGAIVIAPDGWNVSKPYRYARKEELVGKEVEND